MASAAVKSATRSELEQCLDVLAAKFGDDTVLAALATAQTKTLPETSSPAMDTVCTEAQQSTCDGGGREEMSSVGDGESALDLSRSVGSSNVGESSADGQPEKNKQKPGFKQSKKKPARAFDPSMYRQRHIAVQLYYDGRNYSGFSSQSEIDVPLTSGSNGAASAGVEQVGTVERQLAIALQKTRLFLPRRNAEGKDTGSSSKCSDSGSSSCGGSSAVVGAENNMVRRGKAGGRVPYAMPGLLAKNGYSRCGRTDAGVSALGQVVALHLRSNFPPNLEEKDPNVKLPVHPCDGLWVNKPKNPGSEKKRSKHAEDASSSNTAMTTSTAAAASQQQQKMVELDYVSMLNAALPPDVRAVAWAPVSERFSARFSCGQRTYRYFFVRRKLDLTLMAEAAKHLEGEHDFRNFCKVDPVNVSNFVRKLFRVSLHRQKPDGTAGSLDEECENGEHAENREDDFGSAAANHRSAAAKEREVWFFEVQGQAFLWHQVRCMMAVLFLVGQKLEPPSIVPDLLACHPDPITGAPAVYPKKPQYNMASDAPLVLHECGFAKLSFGHSPEALWKLTASLEEQWAAAALKLAQAANALDTVLALPVRQKDVTSLIEQQTRRRLAGTSNREGHLAFFQATHISQKNGGDASEQGSAARAADGSGSGTASSSNDSPSSSERHKKCPRTVSPASDSDALMSDAAGNSSTSSSSSSAAMTDHSTTTTAEATTSETPGVNQDATTMPWRDALVLLGGVNFAPGANKSHVAMRQRQVDLNLEEKVAALKGKQKHRRELHDAYRGAASAEQQDQELPAAEAMEAAERDRAFFSAMRNEGNM